MLYERLLREEVRKLDPIDELSQIAAIEDGSESGIAVAEPIIRELHVRQRPDGERSSPQSESGTITPAIDPEESTPSDLKM